MFFKNLMVYRLPSPWAMSRELLEESLQPQQKHASSSLEMISHGWAAVRQGGDLVHAVGSNFLINMLTEKKILPAAVINKAASDRAQEIEQQQGFKPGRKQMRDIKESVAESLLPRAFSVQQPLLAWIDTQNGWLVLDTASPSRADEFLQLLNKSIDRLPLANLHVEISPVAGMTDWLARDEAPPNFTIDQDTELRAAGEGRATVRYLRQSVEVEDARRHLEAGKQVTRLAMTWADRISFVMTESLAIKSVTPLDVIRENDSIGQNDDERFDSDFAMMAGELNKLLTSLVAALGGEKAD